jgi:hypothetical protein
MYEVLELELPIYGDERTFLGKSASHQQTIAKDNFGSTTFRWMILNHERRHS